MKNNINRKYFLLLFWMNILLFSIAYIMYGTSNDKTKTKEENFYFSMTHYTMTLEGKILHFDIVLNKAREVETIVTFNTINVSAEKEKDYALLDHSIVIPAGETEGIVRVQTLDDNESEGIEFFTLEGKVTLANTKSINNKVIGIIRDNTTPIRLVLGESSAYEGDALLVDINISYPREIDTIIHLSHSDISAEKNKDYDWKDTEVVIAAHRTHAHLRIPVIVDDIAERDETFILYAEVFLPNTNLVAKATQTIHDNNEPIKLLIGNASEKEGDKLRFDVNLSVENTRDTMISLTTTETTAEAGKDYKIESTGVVIPKGEKHTTIDVHTIKDSISEYNETFTLNGTISLNNTLAVTEANGTIIDSTETLTVSVLDEESAEGENMRFKFLLNHPSSEDTVLILNTFDKTATKQKDYEPLEMKVLTIPTGFTTAKVNIIIASDEDVEKNETFILNAEINSSLGKGYEVNATGTIINK